MTSTAEDPALGGIMLSPVQCMDEEHNGGEVGAEKVGFGTVDPAKMASQLLAIVWKLSLIHI